MLPVLRGARATARQVLVYAFVLVAVTLLPATTGTFGAGYVIVSALLGAVFVGFAWRLGRAPTPGRAGARFHFSLRYPALLFTAVALDAAIR